MHDCHYKAGKAVDLEYIDRGASLPIWVINTEVSNAIQNVILLLERNILSGLARVQH